MADIQQIEAQLTEARQQAATAQRQLEERLLDYNGAEDAETASLRSAADLYRSREASLVRVREAAQRANSAAAIEARHQESRNGVRAARALERRYVNAAKALEAALEAVAVARSEFLQVDAELHEAIRAVCMNPELNDAQTSGLYVRVLARGFPMTRFGGMSGRCSTKTPGLTASAIPPRSTCSRSSCALRWRPHTGSRLINRRTSSTASLRCAR